MGWLVWMMKLNRMTKTLNKMDLTERKVWADRVLEKLRDFDLEKISLFFWQERIIGNF
jgi:hypothetical protein